ncbi:MAG: asparagine synthase (glutamine-hydrolyzing) [Thermodesulfobacteriota bacterium]
MCGIAGLFNLKLDPIPAHCLKSMCDVMSHRGPDDEGYVFFHVRQGRFKEEGYWVEKDRDMPGIRGREDWKRFFNGNGDFNLALGHRRLAIIDLSPNGHQPMSNRANGIWVTYNGEIYNFKELRRQLIGQGHSFHSQSDTEVLIHLYEEYGEKLVEHLNGIFAFALWDGRNNRLLLARDRYGVKPLYYTLQSDLLVFASEVKALLEVEGVRAKVNYKALCDYFTFQNTFGDVTLFEGIRILEPGHLLLVENGQINKTRYWDFSFREGEDKGEEVFLRELKDMLARVVERQMISDVPVGSYLSGGMDSGTITAFASKVTPRLMTFTGGFDVATAVSIEHFFDEREKAEIMAREFGTEHYQMVIHAGDLIWALPKVIWHAEDLRVGMSYPHYYLSRLASKFVKVVLAGPGGDEILGGYPWRYTLVKDVKDCHEFEKTIYGYWCRLTDEALKPTLFTPRVLELIGDHQPLNSVRQVLGGDGNTNFVKKALYFDAKTFLHGILVVEDKLSMAHSLESRVPFLDNELVDYSTRIPSKYLLNGAWLAPAAEDLNLSGKYILRRAMEGLLPRTIVENRKQGFSAPDQSWYMQHLVEYIRKTILTERSLARGYFNKEFLERILEEHISGRTNHRLLIWSLLSFEWWNRLFIDGEKIN